MQPHLPIVALVYTDSEAADASLRAVAVTLLERGLRLAGLVQVNRPRPGRSRCDMILEELGSGAHVPISQDRGPHARGCALDVGQLLTAMQLVQTRIEAGHESRPDLVILNKFGKTEAEGGGFREVIAAVIEAELRLLIAVPWRNIESWRHFVGPLSCEIVLDENLDDTAARCLAALGLTGEPCADRAVGSADGIVQTVRDTRAGSGSGTATTRPGAPSP